MMVVPPLLIMMVGVGPTYGGVGFPVFGKHVVTVPVRVSRVKLCAAPTAAKRAAAKGTERIIMRAWL